MIATLLFAAMLVRPPWTPQTPDAAQIGDGFYVNKHGCVTNGKPRVSSRLLPLRCEPVGGVLPSYQTLCYAHNSYDAGNYTSAAMYFQKALAEDEQEKDIAKSSLEFDRFDLGLALYRAGRLTDAKRIWTTLVIPKYLDRATKLASSGHYAAALDALAARPPYYNSIFQFSGAEYNLQRGLNAIAARRYGDARIYLNYSIECSPSFVDPPLVLGFLDVMQGQRSRAVTDFARTLEGGEPQPPDTAGILEAWSDAMYMLSRLL